MKKKIGKLLAATVAMVGMSGCLANPPDTSTGKTEAASLVFSDFEQMAQLALSDRLHLVSIIEGTFDTLKVQAEDSNWTFTDEAIKIVANNGGDSVDRWYVIHQQTNDTLHFQKCETGAWRVDFRGVRIKDSQYIGKIELLTDTLELPIGDPALNQAMNAEGEAINRDHENHQYDVQYRFKSATTLHAAKTENGYEFCVGELDFEVSFPNRHQPKDYFQAELYIDGTAPSRNYIWK